MRTGQHRLHPCESSISRITRSCLFLVSMPCSLRIHVQANEHRFAERTSALSNRELAFAHMCGPPSWLQIKVQTGSRWSLFVTSHRCAALQKLAPLSSASVQRVPFALLLSGCVLQTNEQTQTTQGGRSRKPLTPFLPGARWYTNTSGDVPMLWPSTHARVPRQPRFHGMHACIFGAYLLHVAADGGAKALEALLQAGGVEELLQLLVEDAELPHKVLRVLPPTPAALVALKQTGGHRKRRQGNAQGYRAVCTYQYML